MAIGLGEIGMLAFFVFLLCLAPGWLRVWQSIGRWLVGGLSLMIMFFCVLAEVIRQLSRWSRNEIT